MHFTIDAVYENGVLKPAGPLPLAERQQVRITIEPHTSWVQETSGIIGWKGDAALAEAKAWLRNLTANQAADLLAGLTNGVSRCKDEPALKLVAPPADPKAPPASAARPFAHPETGPPLSSSATQTEAPAGPNYR